MVRIRFAMLLLAGGALVGSPPAAALTLSLSASTDLGALRPGVPFTLDVQLSGLVGIPAVALSLDALGGSVAFDATLLGDASIPAPGPIVPLAGAFTGDVGVGLVTGAFARVTGGAPVALDGVFYRFTLTPLEEGVGGIGFDTSSLFAVFTGSGETVFPEAGPDLAFSVVPEPGVGSLVAFGLCLFGAQRRKRRAWYDPAQARRAS